jgi:uncharacterized protein (TIGR02246 family)
MRKRVTFVVLMFVAHAAFSQKKDVEILTKLNAAWIHSYPTKDKATLQRIFADDFVLINHKGIKMTKKDIIDNLDKQETLSANVDSIDVRLLTDEVGVVTAYTTFVLKTGDKVMTGKNCYQDIYIKRKGKWMAVTAHVTLLSFE